MKGLVIIANSGSFLPPPPSAPQAASHCAGAEATEQSCRANADAGEHSSRQLGEV
eukprot:CAMPEP_0177255128 /NCGR_PEP_ID=MMETSP0367-20130122/56173_1 /TAXON_ID=447022 ORGANISM="Scrippsiella hangoei-like, Strain SHHI-4" /NCGR_SAMPLE_ID=MMETSP0367 /ASSEMBLY_ACC=CAM_ASM_000362 /LENGTH=54 /DNA_ID=CAMNT_0018708785 /DNA_START=66 /DNA_END=226 /DNA_ORIENTATION=-